MYIFFCEKGIIIIVHFFLELYFFSGIIFFSGVIFFWCLDLCFFFPRFESFWANNFSIYQLFSGHWLPNLKNQKLAAQHQQLSTNIVSKQKELYFWGPSNLRNHSFKNYSSGKNGTIFLEGPQTWKNNSFQNYSSGKKGTIFLGGHPNLRKHSFKNYSSGKKGTIFLGGPPNLRKHSFKNYSSGKKRNYIFGRALKPEKAQLPKLYFRKNRNYIFGSVLNVQKNSFKNYSSKRQEKDEEGSETCKSAAPKIVVPKKEHVFAKKDPKNRAIFFGRLWNFLKVQPQRL